MGGRVYDGEIARDPMERWIRNFAANAPAHLGAQEFTSTTQAEGNCDKSDSNFCFLLFIDPNDSKDLITSLQTQFPQDPIRFYWVNKSKHIDFHSKFQHSSVAILRAKRKKYFEYIGEMTEDGIYDFISLVLSGGGSTVKLDSIPTITNN